MKTTLFVKKNAAYLPPVAKIDRFSSKDILTLSPQDDIENDIRWD